jgi:uncharacterized protein (DUF885 family)
MQVADENGLAEAWRIVDDAWEEWERSPYVRRQQGTGAHGLPDVSFAEAERRSVVGRGLIKRLSALNEVSLPHTVALPLRLVRFRAQNWALQAEWYWTVIDPLGTGAFGMFLPTAYCGGLTLNYANGQLASFQIRDAADADHYLGLVESYACLIDQFADRTRGQADRGMKMPYEQVIQAQALLKGFRSSARSALIVAPARSRGVSQTGFERQIDLLLSGLVQPAFDRLLSLLSDDYLVSAPVSVGLGQYPQGRSVYEQLVRFHTTLDLTPEEVHEFGRTRMLEISAAMQSLQAELGFSSSVQFRAHLEDDRRWWADSPEAVAAIFERYLNRFAHCLSACVEEVPETPCGVLPLPETLQGSMTFGYYDAPTLDRNQGVYYFNAANLTRQPLHTLGALTYHELVPGHHLHRSTQRANLRLHPLQRFSFVNAFNEGWAEYAATLAGEMGMYEQPEERYGRLQMDAFLTCRLVVDTGMNALGWTLERAREYLREHSGMSESEILTESVRYSCDIPAQSLAYKLGDAEILAMRETMRRAVGSGFDLKKFHAAVLGAGALPLADLWWHIEHEIARWGDEAASA